MKYLEDTRKSLETFICHNLHI